MSRPLSLVLPWRQQAARRRDRPSIRLPFLLTLPTLLVVFVVIGIPLVYSLALSLHRINMLTQQWIFVGLQNYVDILPDPGVHRGARPHRVLRRGHGDRRPDPRHGDGAGPERAASRAAISCAASC